MSNIRHEIAAWTQVVTIIAIWLILVYATQGNLGIGVEALKRLPEVVIIYVVLRIVFTRWMWRWRVFQGWLIPFPDLQGTWTGQLRSTWKNPETGDTPPPIALSLVVRQTFDAISITMHTEESTSLSVASAFGKDEENGEKIVSYMYSNRPRVSVRHRSAAHDGAAILRVVSGSPMALEGEYWTGRQTTGEMSLQFRDRLLDDAFVPTKA